MQLLANMIDTGYFEYMAEAEGKYDLVNTSTARANAINSIIKTFKNIKSKGLDPNNYIEEVLAKYGMTEDELTDNECKKIMEAVNDRY